MKIYKVHGRRDGFDIAKHTIKYFESKRDATVYAAKLQKSIYDYTKIESINLIKSKVHEQRPFWVIVDKTDYYVPTICNSMYTASKTLDSVKHLGKDFIMTQATLNIIKPKKSKKK